jgi:bifunctional non-homologous end joining protein LigD
MPDRVRVHIDGHELELSNLDKVMYPEVGFTKGEVIDYYVRVAATLLPHLRDRPLTRIRYPTGWTRRASSRRTRPGAPRPGCGG